MFLHKYNQGNFKVVLLGKTQYLLFLQMHSSNNWAPMDPRQHSKMQDKGQSYSQIPPALQQIATHSTLELFL